jgi:hypothetical protein
MAPRKAPAGGKGGEWPGPSKREERRNFSQQTCAQCDEAHTPSRNLVVRGMVKEKPESPDAARHIMDAHNQAKSARICRTHLASRVCAFEEGEKRMQENRERIPSLAGLAATYSSES